MIGMLRRIRFNLVSALLVLSFTAAGLCAQQPAAAMRVGFAEADITPEIGMEQPGGYGKSYHRLIHDPCKVRASVFDDGKKRVAIVGLDALAVEREMVEAARAVIAQKCGIAPEAILISASHSHSGGPVCFVRPGQYDHASSLVRTLAYEKSTAVNEKYYRRVLEQIIAAVCKADSARVEAVCGVGKGIEDQVAFNRRLRMKNGLSYTHPRPGNPDIVGVAGPTDPEVGVIGVWDKEGKLLGCIINFACHATTSPGGISANYICYIEQAIRGFFGQHAIVVFLPGACGDVTQVDNLGEHTQPGGERSAQFVGGRVGAEAVKVLLGVERGNLAPADARCKVLKIKRRVPKPERVRQCFDLVQKDPKEVGATEWTFAKEIVMLDARLAKEPIVEVEIQAVQIGPAVFLTNPSEFFCQLGLDIKSGSPFPFTFPVTLANGSVGYVPTEEAFGEHGGGYETRLTSYSNLEIDAGTRFVRAALELAKAMTPGKAPEPPKAPPFKEPWSYGNVPPERD